MIDLINMIGARGGTGGYGPIGNTRPRTHRTAHLAREHLTPGQARTEAARAVHEANANEKYLTALAGFDQPATYLDLENATGLTRPTIKSAMARLLAMGIVKRIAVPHGNRTRAGFVLVGDRA